MENWCEIFRTGCHKDSKGNEKEWTLGDLEKIKYNFENVNPDVPICCGHPKTNSPAYGWWDKLKIEGNKLFATFKQVQPEFEDACKRGLFKTRSISLTEDLIPRHLAFLGAQSPAIKGLETFCFNEDENDIKIEFSSASQGEQQPVEGCCATVDNRGAYMDSETRTKKDNEALREEIKKLQKRLKDKEEEGKLKEFNDFCNEAIKNGNIIPAQKEGVLNLFQSLEDKNFSFEDGSEKNSKDILKDFILSLKQMDFEEIASKNNLQEFEDINFEDPNEVKEAILKIQKEYETKGIVLSPLAAYDKMKG